MITKEGSTKMVNLMIPMADVLMLRCGHICHYIEYALSSTLSILLLYSGIIMLLSYAIVDFYILHDGVSDMQI